ncbi:MAG: ASKHA domain-containing protein [Coriobacteriales bacterium]|jgi:uncharacterized 2Fe-2S/4Fe-4S cluster protein (DUF4445 family)|nr:ASKHA domain-containing protein [Coriobacteriales bacterium]
MPSDVTVAFTMTGSKEVKSTVPVGSSLLDIAKDLGIPLDAPCSGNMTCGKCKVKVISGKTEGKRTRYVSEEAYEQGWRLACAVDVSADLVVEVPDSASAYRTGIKVDELGDTARGMSFAKLKTDLLERGFSVGGTVITTVLELVAPTNDDPEADKERLVRALAKARGVNERDVRLSLGAMRALPHAIRESEYRPFLVIEQTDNGGLLVIDICAQPQQPLGLAIDIGTTTVSALLSDLDTGDVLAAGTAGNGQIRFGADVINRLVESDRPGGLVRLRKAIVDECIAPLVKSLCDAISKDGESIYRVTVAGNTTMAHLFIGVYGNYLRLDPYIPAFFELDGLRGADLAIGVNPAAATIIAPAVGSYVGGDITAGILASGIAKGDEWSMLIDLGTNGEIVLGSSEFLMACACSAGPAFEGGDISCGMRATDGAIEAITIDEQTMEPKCLVIGADGQRPIGVCGSGIIDAISELFRTGIIDARGRFLREGPRVHVDEWGTTSYTLAWGEETDSGEKIALTDSDIDNFIRAKGSVFSAIRTLLDVAGFSIDDISHINIAGGIGNAIDIEHAIGAGMLPCLPLDRYSYVGNTSLAGAYSLLVSPETRSELSALTRSITYIELSTIAGYMDEFIAACFIPHTDGSLFSL